MQTPLIESVPETQNLKDSQDPYGESPSQSQSILSPRPAVQVASKR